MKTAWKNIWNSNRKWIYLLLCAVLAVQLGFIITTFLQREGLHSDENWSYAFANSYYESSIDSNEDGSRKNFGEWLPATVFRDYVTVQEDERFTYDSVYYNQRGDMSPPFHSMILHTICSFFPNQFSRWFGFSVNIAAWLIVSIMMFCIGKGLTGSEIFALILTAFYGSTTAAWNTFVYLRPYALLTAMVMILFYLHLRMWKGTTTWKSMIGIFVVNVLGAFTHYYYLVIMGILAVVMTLAYFINKRWREIFTYVIGVWLSIFAFFLLYPYALHTVGTGDSVYKAKFPLLVMADDCVTYVMRELTGLSIGLPPLSLVVGVVGGALILLIMSIPVLFLLRNETFLQNWKEKWKAHRIYKKSHPKKTVTAIILGMFFATAGHITVVARISNVYQMAEFTDRYLFAIMPLTAVLLVYLVYFLAKQIGRKQIVGLATAGALVITLLVVNHLNTACIYLFQRNSDSTETIEQITRGADCILVTTTDWHLTCFTSRLLEVDSFFAIPSASYDQYTEQLDKLENNKPVYLILESDFLNAADRMKETFEKNGGTVDQATLDGVQNISIDDVANYYNGLSFTDQFTYVMEETAFNGKLLVYQLR